MFISILCMPIIRRIIVSRPQLVYFTLCRWQSGMQVRMKLTCIPDGHLHGMT